MSAWWLKQHLLRGGKILKKMLEGKRKGLFYEPAELRVTLQMRQKAGQC